MATEAAPSTGLVEGDLLIELERWEAWTHLGPSPRGMPRKYAFQGGLSYSRPFDVRGRILEPEARRGRRARVWISPTKHEYLKTGPGGLGDIGQVTHEHRDRDWDVSVTLLLPEETAPVVATCLASVWRYLRLSTFDGDDSGASIAAWAFSAT